jgi:hypothetical protein
VFSAPGGGPLRKENLRKRVWLPAVKAAGLTNVRIHDLRHTHATWLADARVLWPEIARTLGHTNPSFTINRYAHAISEQAEASADALDARPGEGIDKPVQRRCNRSTMGRWWRTRRQEQQRRREERRAGHAAWREQLSWRLRCYCSWAIRASIP